MYMHPFNLIKIIAAVITVIITFIAGFIELRLNPKNWLNRWFASFFFSVSLGFLAYAIYHSIISNSELVIPIMITAQIIFNFFPISLVMTVFVLEKYHKIAMSPKYLGIMIAIFILMSFGYFIWVPILDPVLYAEGIVNTKTELIWSIPVNFIRIVLVSYVVYKYAMIIRKTEEETKRRIQLFFVGIIIVIIGLFINLTGVIIEPMLFEIIFEIFALILFNLGAIIIAKGFFI